MTSRRGSRYIVQAAPLNRIRRNTLLESVNMKSIIESIPINRLVLISICNGAMLLFILAILCFLYVPSGDSYWRPASMNLTVFVAGWASGWFAGTLVAPYDEGEAGLFSKISKGIWAFVSGFLLAKIDPMLNASIFPLNEVVQFRVLLFLSVAVIVMLIVFFARKYGRWHLEPGPTPVHR